jgi:hypothetical protein
MEILHCSLRSRTALGPYSVTEIAITCRDRQAPVSNLQATFCSQGDLTLERLASNEEYLYMKHTSTATKEERAKKPWHSRSWPC